MSVILSFLMMQMAVAPSTLENPADVGAALGASDVEAEPIATVKRKSLRSSKAALDECLARSCPPLEDIAASVSHADNQIIAGEFDEARKTLTSARARNKKFAKEFPEEVSQLLQFDADVAALLGLKSYHQSASFDAADALKRGLSPQDPRLLEKKIEVADVFVREGRYQEAARIYDRVADQAKQSGLVELEGLAMFRGLQYYAMMASTDPTLDDEAQKRYKILRATTDPVLKPWRDASWAMQARIELSKNKNANVNAVLKNLDGVRSSMPMLVYAPIVDFSMRSMEDLKWATSTTSRDQWVDFTYRISREGKVEDIGVISKSPTVRAAFVSIAQDALAGRRYLPLDVPEGSSGPWRAERFLIVSDMTSVSGSHIRLRAGEPKLLNIDLTSKLGFARGGKAVSAQ